MNKQQLAAKIWASANSMRSSKIEANEYKDYILGFIFYKFLSDREIAFLKKEHWTDDDLKDLIIDDDSDHQKTIKHCQENLGYFISYENLYTTWIDPDFNFTSDKVSTAISCFNQSIYSSHKKVFENIFHTLEVGLSKLGDTEGSRTTAILDLLNLIKPIPIDEKQDYDVLGFIYEYLISNFASNAGKKAGEFYTPHEVSLIMSEIVAYHLKDKEEISIYDPTSGSGSLLINIGKCVAKHMKDKNKIKYYAQEIKENTHNLTRMNLVMRGIIPDNIETRNDDTLEADWPVVKSEDSNKPDMPLQVDAVVSNPPYSQKWKPANKEFDIRFKEFGLAPKGKADLAFLLHDLCHLKPKCIMTIVMPHGVLFRGSFNEEDPQNSQDECKIRYNLIDNNYIDTIIGLPPNIFFGTTIPTIIVVLKKNRSTDDILFIDASQGFVKDGKKNKLRPRDIKKISDVVNGRLEIEHYSRKVKRSEIEKNQYNLNISRYIDSNAKINYWDLYATMYGGIPNKEIELYGKYWEAFPSLREQIFEAVNDTYSSIKSQDLKSIIFENKDVKTFIDKYKSSFNGFDKLLHKELINNMLNVNVPNEEPILSSEIFKRIKNIPLVDKYLSYQLLDNVWRDISIDLEIIQSEGKQVLKEVEDIIEYDKTEEKVLGRKGKIIPFGIVQNDKFPEMLSSIKDNNKKLESINLSIAAIIDSMTDEEKDQDYLNDDNDAFKVAELKKEIKSIYNEYENQEIKILKDYLNVLSTSDKSTAAQFINNNNIVIQSVKKTRDGLYKKSDVNKEINSILSEVKFDEDSIEHKLIYALSLLDNKKEIEASNKKIISELSEKTENVYATLTDEEIVSYLVKKWITPLIDNLNKLPYLLLEEFSKNLIELSDKYEETMIDIEGEIQRSENKLNECLSNLVSSKYDKKALEEFKNMLGVDKNESK